MIEKIKMFVKYTIDFYLMNHIFLYQIIKKIYLIFFKLITFDQIIKNFSTMIIIS